MIRLRYLVALLAAVIASGTVFFRMVEGWSWLDSYYFTVVTLSTVGYGDLIPQTPIGRIGTTVFIITGLGLFAAVIQRVGVLGFARRDHRRRDTSEEAKARHLQSIERSKKK
jgi:voltage-gated potassium channel